MRSRWVLRLRPHGARPYGHAPHRGRWAAAVPGAAATAKAARPGKPGAVPCGPQTACYTPRQYQVAYGASALLSRGIDGRGETVAMPEPANTPTHGVTFTDIRKDLATFD